jgi:hypothetical protein
VEERLKKGSIEDEERFLKRFKIKVGKLPTFPIFVSNPCLERQASQMKRS